MPVLAADGCHITTVEGVGTVKGDNMHPIQKAMTELHGSQCGFCTPGIIMSIYSLYANNPSTKHIEEHLDGNLCRCTGYRPIWDAARSLCDDAEELVHGPCGTACRDCPERDECEQDCNVEDKKKAEEADEVCCSSSKDKVAMKASFIGTKEDWLDQPNKMFPDALLQDASFENIQLSKPLMVVDDTEYQGAGTWFKPASFLDLLALLKEFGGPLGGGYKIVVGNTEVGIGKIIFLFEYLVFSVAKVILSCISFFLWVETRFKNSIYPRLIYPGESIQPLYGFSASPEKIVIGACTPLSVIQHKSEKIGEDSIYTRTSMPMHDMLRWFASSQIRNVASLAGNLVTACPISDMNPLLASMGATLILSKLGDDNKSISRRVLPVSDFFLRYRTVDLESTEIVERIEVPVLAKTFEYVKPFKQARRREDDISIVTSGMKIRLVPNEGGFTIEHIAIAFGGMAPRTVMAVETAKTMIGAVFCKETFKKAEECLLNEMKLPESVPGGQAAYRMALASSFLYKFYISVVQELKDDISAIAADPSLFPSISRPLPPLPDLSDDEVSGSSNFLSAEKPSFSGVQTFPAPKVAKGAEENVLPNTDSARSNAADVVGKSKVHQSGALHCTGEALYTDDIPLPPGTLEASLILSSECGGVLESLDLKPCLAIPGVVGAFSAEDVKKLNGKNYLGPIVKDEFVFLPLGERVSMVGQVLGIVVGETLECAEMGARVAGVKYGPCDEKVILTCEEAIAANSFYEPTRHSLQTGDEAVIESLLATEDTKPDAKLEVGSIVKVSGKFHSGAQEHFYLETNASIVIPSESDTNLTVYCSTQAVDKTQRFCASSTGTPAHKVVVRMKRMGGGFGGKETRSVFASCAAAVAAKRSSRPVRLTLPRNVDMLITGHRHAFFSTYDASAEITEDGAKLVALDIHLYNNGGCGRDLSGPVADRALFHVDGCYKFPHIRAETIVCKTDQAPHTAYRGFGGPQGMAACENVMEHLAFACNVPVDKFRQQNFYKVGDTTHFGSYMGEPHMGKWNVPGIWDRLNSELSIVDRRALIDEFNSKNKWIKRGAALIPTRFGIAFTSKFMNQGGALVHLYQDGTVLVSHGGTEMGQGLHTKVCQVAAQAFGIPIEDVYINDSSSDKVANSQPTAASMSTDLYGMCTLDACRQILARLKPYREKFGPSAPLSQIAVAAFFDRVDLTAHGFYALDGKRCGYDFLKEKPDNYPEDLPENSWKGNPFNYFTQGVAYCEVEIDILTGNHRTLRSDVVVDVGSSINPSIDIGQIEGAFTQGMGWSTIEEVAYADEDHTWARPRGNMITQGPGTYKIPAFNDQPEIFNVSLLDNVDNPFAVHSSKAVGEPPFYLGTVVYYAIKDAIKSARKTGAAADTYFELLLPATSECIRIQANDEIGVRAKTAMLGDAEAAATYQTQGSF